MRFSWKSEHKIPEPVAEEMGILEGVRQKQRMSFSYKMVFFLKKLRVIKGRAPKYHMLFSYKIIGVRACVRAFVLACMCVCVCVYVCVIVLLCLGCCEGARTCVGSWAGARVRVVWVSINGY